MSDANQSTTKSRELNAGAASHPAAPAIEHPTTAINAPFETPKVSGPAVTIKQIEANVLDDDKSIDGLGMDMKEWYATVHRVQQQNTMIKAMIKIFAWLNGSVISFVLLAWEVGFWSTREPIITEHVVMSLIGATIIQAGLAFITITKFLFPSAGAYQTGEAQSAAHDKGEKPRLPSARRAPK